MFAKICNSEKSIYFGMSFLLNLTTNITQKLKTSCKLSITSMHFIGKCGSTMQYNLNAHIKIIKYAHIFNVFLMKETRFCSALIFVFLIVPRFLFIFLRNDKYKFL
ncbi:hypothetical protein EDEG_01851 [Edhazardia aedis USNM 41457]|uniref:Uncharacterized protein n=1 Tax=Edhazardia aedis (strain USNM 41457) TaxID=1003232 RepID=J9DR83_EDHAE|nr:hypothetical protein EDEG_01851 [Edhazardia aedis USNM 41457]|eukprot:EJW03852.1 hypothetical protein EDEG_01851 [Edhazardia aedis USNM 41457]